MPRRLIVSLICAVPVLALLALFCAGMAQSAPPASGNFDDYKTYFQALAQDKGAAEAFDVMRATAFPQGVDLHLLGHVVGDVLYKQKGIDGIKVCTNDFRNACSHAIVIGAFLEKGEAALPEIAQACHQAPGGSGAYTMCFHGLGHGILSYVGYDLPQAISLCKKTGTAAYHDREYIECVGGTIMEMQWGSFDPQTWKLQAAKYFKADDPLYPCDASFMPADVRGICYNYLTPYLWQSVGGDLGDPTPAVFAKAFPLCARISAPGDRRECYRGFGKEFDALAAGRDVREGTLQSLSDENLGEIYTWCALADSSEGKDACLRSALDSLYWGGENVRTLGERFCAAIPVAGDQRTCVDELIADVAEFIPDQSYRDAFCAELPESFRSGCTAKLLTP